MNMLGNNLQSTYEFARDHHQALLAAAADRRRGQRANTPEPAFRRHYWSLIWQLARRLVSEKQWRPHSTPLLNEVTRN